ncbi:DUF2975 domain-containing protein [Thalassobellus suaedae]|uniref:DUF2975 domain-containing protein n=1 Tax=Thalassobellus suaedae TaxID=3074124 RepID=A0ABY9XRF4_9FLAO|nr:DUF2975 domain-containing protein [Flavobacteriaceae bacterium HL-DH14]
MDKDFYSKGEFNFNSQTNAFNAFTKWKKIDVGEDKEVYSLEKITTSSLYLNYFKYVAVLLVIFLLIKEFQKVMQSVKHFNTFREDNIKSFRKIGKYLFMFFLLTCYFAVRFQDGGISGFSISFTPLILMLLAFVFAEIFKEGNFLMEENELTI